MGAPATGRALDANLLARDGHRDSLLLGHDLLGHAYGAGLALALADLDLLLGEGHGDLLAYAHRGARRGASLHRGRGSLALGDGDLLELRLGEAQVDLVVAAHIHDVLVGRAVVLGEEIPFSIRKPLASHWTTLPSFSPSAL